MFTNALYSGTSLFCTFHTGHGNAGIDGTRDSPVDGANATLVPIAIKLNRDIVHNMNIIINYKYNIKIQHIVHQITTFRARKEE